MDKIKISTLNKAPYNPRQITPENYARLIYSIKGYTKFLEGWDEKNGYRLITTITVNRKGMRIVGGHQRLDGLIDLKQDWVHNKDITWVNMEPGGFHEKALNAALNNSNLAGEWDYPKLKDLISEMDVGEFDIALTGFDINELKGIFSWEVKEPRDPTPDVQPETKRECPQCGYKW